MSWAAAQLAEFITALASLSSADDAKRVAVERAAEAFDADAAALVEDGEVSAALGFPAARVPEGALAELVVGELETLDVVGVGPCGVVSVQLSEDRPGAFLVLASSDRVELDAEEAGLLRGMARALALTTRGLDIVGALRERQRLLERLSRIQRSISRSASADEVFEAITAGASELLRDEIVGIRLVDRSDRSQTILRHVSGVPSGIAEEIQHRAVGLGVSGRAIAEGRLVVTEDYARDAMADRALAEAGIRSAMAAPIFEEGWIAGSLVVATREPQRRYSAVEREIVRTFAEHASLALTATRAVEASRERALASREMRFRALVQTSAELILVLGADGRIEYQSPSASRLLGYALDEMVGHEPRRFVASGDVGRVDDYLESIKARPGIGPRIEWHWRHVDGTEVEAETVANNLLDDPNVNGIVLTARDLTERKREERQRRKLEAQLEQAQRLEGIGQLAGGIAHDFSNLLSVIHNYSEFVRDGLPDDEALRDDLAQIQLAADRGAQLVDQLLAFSRRDIASPQVVDVEMAIHETEGMLERTLGEQYELRTIVAEDLPSIHIDTGKLGQVLINLVVNARDAMPEGGVISIEADRVEIGPDDESDSTPPGSYVRLVVRDHGCGMEPATAAHAFEPFFTTKPEGEGTGLGLAMVYGIVSQAGGFTGLETEPGVGTEVSALLPAMSGPARREDEPVVPAPAPGAGRAVLVVEDEPAVRALTKRILARHGYRVHEASDGLEAVEFCRRHGEAIDLLITDVVMPAMSGKELAERIEEFWPQIPVLFMSGYTKDVVAHQGVADGSLRLLQKPFDPDQLLHAVEGALNGERRGR